MKEEIITFETAKLADKKGFKFESEHWYCLKQYDDQTIGSIIPDYECYSYIEGIPYNKYAPVVTQSLLQKWLREEHNLYVIVDTVHTLVGEEVIKVEWKYSITSDKDDDIKCIWNGKETYEEALEVGLFEALKLIK